MSIGFSPMVAPWEWLVHPYSCAWCGRGVGYWERTKVGEHNLHPDCENKARAKAVKAKIMRRVKPPEEHFKGWQVTKPVGPYSWAKGHG